MGRAGGSTGEREGLAPIRTQTAVVGAWMALAVALRWIGWARADAMFNDGPLFLGLAALVGEGRWSEALAHDYHPLYPLAIAGARLVLGPLGVQSSETAAVAVCVAGGALAVLFLYLFLREAFGWVPAALGAGLLAVHSRAVEYTSDIQSEGLYLPLFLAGLWVGWRAWRRRSAGWAAGTGALAGLAYLTRPEGLGLALVVGALGTLEVVGRRWRPGAWAAWAAALAAGALLFVLPYAGFLRLETGAWSLTQKKSVAALTGLGGLGGLGGLAGAEGREAGAGRDAAGASLGGELGTPGRSGGAPRGSAAPAPASFPGWRAPGTSGAAPRGGGGEAPPRGSLWAALGELESTVRSAARAETLVVLVLGLVASRGRPGARGRFLLVLGLLYGAILLALTVHAGYVSRRHVLPVLAALFGYAGLGIQGLGHLAAEGMGRLTRGRLALSARAALAVGGLLVAIPALGTQVPARRHEKLAARLAAEWLRAHEARPGAVAARKRRVAYYAGALHVPVASTDPDALLPWLRRSGATHLIVAVDELGEGAGERLAAARELRLVHRVVAKGEEARIFAVGEASRGTDGARSRAGVGPGEGS